MNRIILALGGISVLILVILTPARVTTAQNEEEQKKPQVTLELIWEKEFEEGIVDVAFDKQRQGLFCPTVVVTGNTENAKAILFLDDRGTIAKSMKLKEWSQARISENGRYIGVMHPDKYDKEFHYGPVDIRDISGEIVKRIDEVYGTWWWVSPNGDEVIEKSIWADADIYYFRGTPGKGEANLTEPSGDISTFAGRPAIRWTGTENKYLQIGNKRVTSSVDGKYLAFPEYVSQGEKVTNRLLLYHSKGVLLKDFDLKTGGSLHASFSPDSRFLAVAVENLVSLIDVERRKILWTYESDDPHQVLNRSSTIDFALEGPFSVAGVFHHHEHLGPEMRDERILLFSMQGEVILNALISKTLDTIGRNILKVNEKGDMLCFVSGHKVRVFQVGRTK